MPPTQAPATVLAALLLAATAPAGAALDGLFPLALPGEVWHEATITLDLAAAGAEGPFPRGLLGTAHHPWSPGVVEAARAAGVPHMRVDAYFDRAAPAPGVFRWAEMDQRLGLIRASGAEAVLILSYTPPWLAACPSPPPLEPRFCPPADLAAWQEVVRAGVRHAAQRWGVRDFEVWNEPDHPGFWRGTLADYLALYGATAAAVQQVARELGVPLRVGGPALAMPEPQWLAPFLATARAQGWPVDFVSFHWYGDYPLFGPVGALPGTGLAENPLLLAQTYAQHVAQVRMLADGHGFPDAEVWVDEWNVNAGDSARMRGPFGAAFVVAVVDAMAGAGADRASFFNVEHDVWGLFSRGEGAEGAPRPSWKAMRALLALEGVGVPVRIAGSPWVAVLAARSAEGEARAVVANLNGQVDAGVRVTLQVTGDAGTRWVAEVRDLDGALLQEATAVQEGFDLELRNLDARQVRLRPAGR